MGYATPKVTSKMLIIIYTMFHVFDFGRVLCGVVEVVLHNYYVYKLSWSLVITSASYIAIL